MLLAGRRAHPVLFPSLVSLAGLVWLCATASPSEACKKRHQTPFELFDVAATVAHVRVQATPPPKHVRNAPGPGDVHLDVIKLLKEPPPTGKAPKPAPAQLVSNLDGSSCDVPFAAGDTALIFLDAAGWTEGAHEGYLRAASAWQPVIEAWAKAKAEVASRAAVLVEAATGPDEAVRREAAYFLVDEPALLASLDAGQRGRLSKQLAASATAGADPTGDRELALVLVRLRDRTAIPRLPRWMKLARAVAAITRFESESDPAALATAITTARRPAERWAAFERCERVRATRLASFRRAIDDLDKVTPAALATSCREGTALAL